MKNNENATIKVDWLNPQAYKAYVAENYYGSDINNYGDEFIYDSEKRIICRVDGDDTDNVYYYIYDNDIIYVCNLNADDDYYYMYDKNTKRFYVPYYDDMYNLDMFKIRKNGEEFYYMIDSDLDGESVREELRDFWENEEFYLKHIKQYEHSRDFDDDGNKFIYDQEKRIIYRENYQHDEFYYIYDNDTIYIHSCNDFNIDGRFYKYNMSESFIIESRDNDRYICKIIDRKYLFAIHALNTTKYMDIGVNLQ